MKKTVIFFIVLVAIIVIASLVYVHYINQNFSKSILTLEILGPAHAKAGDQVEYTVTYKNNGNFVLQSPKLIFDIPDNSLTEDGKTRFTQNLEDIGPGIQGFIQFKARLLGKEQDIKTAHVWLSYVPKNLSIRYEGEATFTTTIDTVPVTLDFDLPSKVEKGKEITYAINYFSNIDYPLENLSIKVDSADGFNFESATPASLDNTEWKLAPLNKAQGGRISIKGLVSGDVGSQLHFAAHLGMWQNGDFIVIKDFSKDIDVINPLVLISQQINGSSDYVATPGETLHYQILFQNAGFTSFDNVSVQSVLVGSLFDMTTLHSNSGQATVKNNVITWNWQQIPGLVHVSSGQQISFAFDVTLKNNVAITGDQKNNMLLKNTVTVSETSQEFDTKVNSNLSLSQKAYYSSQAGIQNSGPIPPQVNQATTYTIVWQVGNTFDDVKNVKVKATLPEGVILTSTIIPTSQISQFSLDSSSRQIVWSAGDLLANASAGSLPSISFQISLTPNLLQQGKLASLIGSATISGDDQFTGKVISNTAPALDTSLPDEASNSGGGIVR